MDSKDNPKGEDDCDDFEEIEGKLKQKYGEEIPPLGSIGLIEVKGKWEVILQNGSLKDFVGKSILDLGCGSKNSKDDYDRASNRNSYEPWFCRTLKELGAARVVGVDIAPNDNEEFEHFQLDLTHPENLSIFSDDSFDFVNAARFIFPPRDDFKSSPTLERMTNATQRGILDILIREQVERILREGGVYLRGNDVFVKENRKLSYKGDYISILIKKYKDRKD